MGRDAVTGKPLQGPDGLTPVSDPVAAYAAQVDAGALDVASFVFQLARNACQATGRPCGLQSNLSRGECPAALAPCPFGRPSGRPSASTLLAGAADKGKGGKRK